VLNLLFGQPFISSHRNVIPSERASVETCKSAAAESDLFVALSVAESPSAL
jgi:hypothetical protein